MSPQPEYVPPDAEDTQDGKVLKIVLKQRLKICSLKIKTMGYMSEVFAATKYEKSW
jgi:hypothetical protein